jgi:hypothetical protein
MRRLELQEGRKPSYIVAVTALARADQKERGLNEYVFSKLLSRLDVSSSASDA